MTYGSSSVAGCGEVRHRGNILNPFLDNTMGIIDTIT